MLGSARRVHLRQSASSADKSWLQPARALTSAKWRSRCCRCYRQTKLLHNSNVLHRSPSHATTGLNSSGVYTRLARSTHALIPSARSLSSRSPITFATLLDAPQPSVVSLSFQDRVAPSGDNRNAQAAEVIERGVVIRRIAGRIPAVAWRDEDNHALSGSRQKHAIGIF